MEAAPKFLVVDTETEPIAPDNISIPAFAAAGWVGNDGIREITQDKDYARCTVQSALDSGCIIAGHNIPFDLDVLGIVPTREQHVWDTMIYDILERLALDDCGEDHPQPPVPRSLEKLYNCPMEGKGMVQLSYRAGHPLTPEQERYLHQDVTVTQLIFLKQYERGSWALGELSMQVRARLALSVLERTGLPVDDEALIIQETEYKILRQEAAMVLGESGVWTPERIGKRGGKFKEKTLVKVFSAHVQKVIEEMEEEVTYTEKGNMKLDKQVLSQLTRDPVIKAWLAYKSCEKLLTTYLKVWKGAGTVHARYRLMMRSGRTSSHSPNLQQVPSRGDRANIKKVFRAPPGRFFYELDYSQLELCCLAYLTQGEMLRRINAGDDLHRYLATVYFSKPRDAVTKEERQLMKCFHPETEFLTRRGWCTIWDIGEQEILQATPVAEGAPLLSWARPFSLFSKPATNLVTLTSENVALSVTPDHRMLVQSGTGAPNECLPEEVPTRRAVWHAGNLEGTGLPSEATVRLAVATQADGSFEGNRITFGLTKRRKQRRIQALLVAAGLSPTQRTCSGVVRFTIDAVNAQPIKALLSSEKELQWNWLSFTHGLRTAAVDEAAFWDSHVSNRSYIYCSTRKQNIDVLQALSMSVGRRATVGKPPVRTNPAHADCYKLTVADRSWSRADSISVAREVYTGDVVCLSVPSSYVVVRFKGKIIITGQCANFGLPGGMGTKTFRMFIRANGLPDPGERGASALRDAWHVAYPEMKRWLRDPDSDKWDRTLRQVWSGKDTVALTDEAVECAWEQGLDRLSELARTIPSWIYRRLFRALSDGKGAAWVENWLVQRKVTVDGGRTRCPVSYTEQHNTRFQGLAANLTKDALARVVFEMPVHCLVHAFIHDAVLISVPESPVMNESANIAASKMLEATTKWLPGVRCEVEISGPGMTWHGAKKAESWKRGVE